MCGIVGAVAQRNVVPILVEGLKRLEYRGYDSAGVAVIDNDNELSRVRTKGKAGGNSWGCTKRQTGRTTGPDDTITTAAENVPTVRGHSLFRPGEPR